MTVTGNVDWNKLHRGWRSKGPLPHFDMPGLYQFITFRLVDSLSPAASGQLHRAARAGSEEFTEELDTLLDSHHGASWLRDPHIATLVQDALLHFDGERYNLLAWCIMPNHVHVLIRVIPGWPLAGILQSWKSFTAKEANKILGRTGAFWEHGYFDRMIRDDQHLHASAQYTEYNPVKANLCARPEDWPYASTRYRNSAAS